MPKHTPGPWKVIGGRYGLPEVWNADQTEAVCERVFNGSAALIADAPKMLELLYECIPYIEECEQFNRPECRRLSTMLIDMFEKHNGE